MLESWGCGLYTSFYGTLLSHPQVAYELIEAGGAEDILQNKIYINIHMINNLFYQVDSIFIPC